MFDKVIADYYKVESFFRHSVVDSYQLMIRFAISSPYYLPKIASIYMLSTVFSILE